MKVLKALKAFGGVIKPFLEGESTPSGLDFTGLLTALTGAVTAQQIIGYMAAIVGVVSTYFTLKPRAFQASETTLPI